MFSSESGKSGIYFFVKNVYQVTISVNRDTNINEWEVDAQAFAEEIGHIYYLRCMERQDEIYLELSGMILKFHYERYRKFCTNDVKHALVRMESH